MWTETLNYRDGGLYPQNSSVPELRARTVLARAYYTGKLNTMDAVSEDDRLVLFSFERETEFTMAESVWCIQKPVNTGLIYVTDANAGWVAQPKRLYLFLKKDINIKATLEMYFQIPLRWLDDHKDALKRIDESFEAQ